MQTESAHKAPTPARVSGLRAAAIRCAHRPAADWYDGGAADDPFASACFASRCPQGTAGLAGRVAEANRNLKRVSPPWIQPVGVLDLADGALDSLPLLLAKAADVGFERLVVVTRTERLRRPVQRACIEGFTALCAPAARCVTTTRRSVPTATAVRPDPAQPAALADGPVARSPSALLLVTRLRTAEAWRPWVATLAGEAPTLVVGCNLKPGALLRFAAEAGFSVVTVRPA